jgi:homospermidine synthase
MPAGEPQDVKERQARKIKEVADTLVAAGFTSLDEQAKALGLSRSTTWTILQAKHKNYGLSAALISRVLAKPGLNSRVRAKIIEYVRERAAGSYGHNDTQLRRFIRIFPADVNAPGSRRD